MAYKIGDECICCGACAGQCPMDCIAMGDSHYDIDADVCISCGSCAGACPMGAIEQA